MSWNVTLIGKTKNIVNALKAQSEKLEGPSKVEFDAALPNITGLLEQNFNDADVEGPLMKLTASGHGYDTYRQCIVSLEFLGCVLV